MQANRSQSESDNSGFGPLWLGIFLVTFALVPPARADTVLVFNEIMYHPATNEATLEWVEFKNQMAIDVDISGWSIAGGIQYTFPSNTIVCGGAFLVASLSPATLMGMTGLTNVVGPFAGRLSNQGEKLQLVDNSGRVVDEVSYAADGDWPVAPDGSGVSLAKIDPDTASSRPANWTWSEQAGGTPGADNFPYLYNMPASDELMLVDAAWRYNDSGADLGSAWRNPAYDDSSWSARASVTNQAIPSLFNTGLDADGQAQNSGAPDAHYLLTATAQGPVNTNATVLTPDSSWWQNDLLSSWVGVVNGTNQNVNPGSYNFQTTFSWPVSFPGPPG